MNLRRAFNKCSAIASDVSKVSLENVTLLKKWEIFVSTNDKFIASAFINVKSCLHGRIEHVETPLLRQSLIE